MIVGEGGDEEWRERIEEACEQEGDGGEGGGVEEGECNVIVGEDGGEEWGERIVNKRGMGEKVVVWRMGSVV